MLEATATQASTGRYATTPARLAFLGARHRARPTREIGAGRSAPRPLERNTRRFGLRLLRNGVSHDFERHVRVAPSDDPHVFAFQRGGGDRELLQLLANA